MKALPPFVTRASEGHPAVLFSEYAYKATVDSVSIPPHSIVPKAQGSALEYFPIMMLKWTEGCGGVICPGSKYKRRRNLAILKDFSDSHERAYTSQGMYAATGMDEITP